MPSACGGQDLAKCLAGARQQRLEYRFVVRDGFFSKCVRIFKPWWLRARLSRNNDTTKAIIAVSHWDAASSNRRQRAGRWRQSA
jgi:hypothetical protein